MTRSAAEPPHDSDSGPARSLVIQGARSTGLRDHRIVDPEVDRALRLRERDRAAGELPLLVRVEVTSRRQVAVSILGLPEISPKLCASVTVVSDFGEFTVVVKPDADLTHVSATARRMVDHSSSRCTVEVLHGAH